VRLEASTKPHVHNLIHEFLINMAFTMACPNFKKGLKMVSGPLGVKDDKNPKWRRILDAVGCSFSLLRRVCWPAIEECYVLAFILFQFISHPLYSTVENAFVAE
jgi:hypothetical protein